MAETAAKMPVKTGGPLPSAPMGWADWPSMSLGDLRRQVDRLFEDFSSGFPLGRWAGRGAAALVPAIDVAENDKAYVITAELPGMDEKNVELVVANDVLAIRGEKREEKEEKKKDYHLSERRYGAFERSFALPAGVDSAGIGAAFRNGVLTVTLPKSEAAQKQQRKIAIKAT